MSIMQIEVGRYKVSLTNFSSTTHTPLTGDRIYKHVMLPFDVRSTVQAAAHPPEN